MKKTTTLEVFAKTKNIGTFELSLNEQAYFSKTYLNLLMNDIAKKIHRENKEYMFRLDGERIDFEY